MSADVIERHFQALRDRDWAELEASYHPLVAYADPDGEWHGAAAVVERARALEAPFSGVRVEQAARRDCGGCVVVEWNYRAVNHGRLRTSVGIDFPATGRHVTIAGVSIFIIEGGRIVSERSYWDNLALYSQLGLVADPAVLGSW
jgi:ketosteroid isomerase-like protein